MFEIYSFVTVSSLHVVGILGLLETFIHPHRGWTQQDTVALLRNPREHSSLDSACR